MITLTWLPSTTKQHKADEKEIPDNNKETIGPFINKALANGCNCLCGDGLKKKIKMVPLQFIKPERLT